MIPALILFLIKKFKGRPIAFLKTNALKTLVIKILVLVVVVLLVSSFIVIDFNNSKIYNVVKNEKVIGVIKINKHTSESSIVYTLSSTIKVKLLLKFDIVGKEKAIYKNGVLTFSSVYRTLNNKVKVNHNIVLNNNQYQVQSSNDIKYLDYKTITHNLVMLYFQEPIGVTSIFCDNQKEMVPVKALSEGKYKVEISNDKYNVFHYKNGKCIKIEAVSKLFSVILIPAES
ncbi:DUF6134 family protein [Aestuariivivens insulae]|uniref:DUF6134 family protein n=1 Tax=Aestuariivivens insulae TaxID=1621988 RepID=UPI001F5765CB|nr:DUF6134 family protein [Aestuariivivens insulae]